MPVSLYQRLQVANFDTWLNPDASQVFEMMGAQGALSVHLTRNLEDPNSLMVHMQFEDADTARAFIGWMESMIDEWVAMDEGFAQEIREWWLGEVIESHSGPTS